MALLKPSEPINVPQAVQQALEFHRQGKTPQAEQLYADVLRVRPDYFEALHMLGLIRMQKGDLPGALLLMSHALRARPKSPEVLLNYGVVLESLGRYDEALVAFDQVISVKRRSVEAHNNRGAVLEKLGRDTEALECFQSALAIKSNHVDALYNHGSVAKKLEHYEQAIKSFDRALAIKPDHAKAHNNRGTALELLSRYEEALTSYERALALVPNFVEALNNRGNVLQKLGRHDDAVKSYERALEIKPDYAEVLNNRSNSLATVGRHQEALASCSRATAINPLYINAQWNEGLLRLRLGDFADGWKKYEWRWKRGDGLKTLRTFPQPQWLGQVPVAGKTILVHFEQGLGDTIQFARYARLLVQQGARVILEVQPPLKSLLSQIGPGIQVISSGEEIPPFDLYSPLMTLPLAFGTGLAGIPPATPYLTVPLERVEHWRQRTPQHSGLRVGLVWSGNATHKDDHNRSIAFARLAPILDTPNVQFCSLQKELRETDAATLGQEPRVTDLGRHFGDFLDTAAAIAAVDLVVTVDTSVAHLAGALGKPVWVLLPFCPDWRWLLERNDSPWYPTMRLFRQSGMGDWEGVLGQVGRELARLAAQV